MKIGDFKLWRSAVNCWAFFALFLALTLMYIIAIGLMAHPDFTRGALLFIGAFASFAGVCKVLANRATRRARAEATGQQFVKSGELRLARRLLVIGTCFLGASVFDALFIEHDAFEDERALADLSSLAMHCSYYIKITGDLPTTEQGLEALVQRPTTLPMATRWWPALPQLPVDPWKRPYGYRRLDSKAAKFELFSLGPDGSESADDIRETHTFRSEP